MKGFTGKLLGAVATAILVLGCLPQGDGEETGGNGAFRVGVVSSLFRDIPEPMIPGMLRPMRSLLETQTGMSGNLVPVKNWDQLGEQIDSEKVHLGVFHGFEFAWAKQKYPDLKPLVVSVGKKGVQNACIVVSADSKTTDLAALKGTTFALPLRTREHCRLFLERYCQRCECTLQKYFGQVTRPFSAEEGLVAVLEGRVRAVLVDGALLEWYRQRRPEMFARLKVVEKSEPFPPAVFACRPGTLDDATIRRFVDGMLTAHENESNQEIMAHIQITRFEKVPADYEKALAAIAKTYPPPAAK